MAYIIYNNDDTVLLTLADGQLDVVSTSLDLIGKNLNNYGQYVNTNLVRLLTNFASTDDKSPRSPQIGQLWYNKTSNKLTVYDGAAFVSAYGTQIAATQPVSTSTGDLWYDTINSQLSIWNGNSFKLVGPNVSGIYGKFGVEPPTTSTIKTAYTNIPQQVGVLYSYGHATAFITTVTFAMSTASSVTFLGTGTATNVVAGLTIFDDLEVKGDIYVQGNTKTPTKHLTTYYDITRWGNPEDSVASTSTRLSYINNANNYLRLTLLNKIFPTVTTSTYNQVGYALGSEVRVFCEYKKTTTATSLVSVADTGTLTLSISTSNVVVGQFVEGSTLIPNGTVVTTIGENSISLSAKVIDRISTGTYLAFNEIIPSVRRFRLQEISPGVITWEPYNLYLNPWTTIYNNIVI